MSLAAAQEATRTIHGTIADSLGNPVPYTSVDAGNGHRTLGDALGRFTLSMRGTAPLTLQVRRIGYRPLLVPLEGGDTSLTLSMVPLVQQLASIRIAAERIRALELHGFYSRMADHEKWGGSGRFVTPEEMEFRKPNRVTQLFDARHGVQVKRVGTCRVIAECWVPLATNDCVMTVYLDGQRLMPEGRALAPSNASALRNNVVYLDALITPSSVSGMEIYQRGTGAPPQYQMLNGRCGVILIWTK